MKTDSKYCPKCKKMVAVVKCGKPKKQRYKCGECGGRFFDRKYGVEMRSLAVKLRDFGYSYREIAKIFGIKKDSPNSVRNWVIESCTYPIPYQKRLEEIKKYKEICESIKKLQTQIQELEQELPYAEEYWQKKNKINELEQKQNSLDMSNRYSAIYYDSYAMAIDRLHKEIVKLRKPKDFMTVEQIQSLQLTIKNELDKKINLKNDIQVVCPFAKDNYDLDKVISILQEITQI